MEDLSDEIMEELKQKAIEKEPTVIKEVSVEKPKRERSEKQKAAFEKARLKRAENLKLKKEQKEKQKLTAKEQKKLVKQKIEEQIKMENDESHGEYKLSKVSEKKAGETEYKPVQEPLVRQQTVGNVRGHEPINPREQVVNNYYYYGMPQPQPVYYEEKPQKKKRGRKPKRPPTPVSSSESESESEQEIVEYDEPDTYKELQKAPVEEEPVQYHQPKPKLKFRFA
jgi:hypothetical protein